MKQTPWFERRFDFGSGQQVFPATLERLIGTPVRIREKLRGIHPQLYPLRVDQSWSILEHIGHLSDLETLWQGRLDDILTGKPELRTTDLTNTRTTLANHNAKGAEALIAEFSTLRKSTLQQLETLTEEQIFLSALHPRLKTPMTVQDLFVFVAEHDDHHLASMSALHKILLKG